MARLLNAFPSSGCHSLVLNLVSTGSTTPLELSTTTRMETLTVHLGLDELVDHATLLEDKYYLHRQPWCADLFVGVRRSIESRDRSRTSSMLAESVHSLADTSSEGVESMGQKPGAN
jgi:hypothetical protein